MHNANRDIMARHGPYVTLSPAVVAAIAAHGRSVSIRHAFHTSHRTDTHDLTQFYHNCFRASTRVFDLVKRGPKIWNADDAA